MPATQGLYKLRLAPLPPSSSSTNEHRSLYTNHQLTMARTTARQPTVATTIALVAHHPPKRAQIDVWHRLMGHISRKVLARLPSTWMRA